MPPHAPRTGDIGLSVTDLDRSLAFLEIYAPTGAESAQAPVAAAPTCGFF